jgi:glutathione S-transferase
MKLHWSPRSPFVRKVMIVAHERGVADRLQCVRTVADTAKPHAELMKDNLLSKIPTLVLDDGMALYDSSVICEYLDALDGEPKLFPQHGQARIVALRHQALGDGFLDLLVLARNERMRAQPSEATWRVRPREPLPCWIVWTTKLERSRSTNLASAI